MLRGERETRMANLQEGISGHESHQFSYDNAPGDAEVYPQGEGEYSVTQISGKWTWSSDCPLNSIFLSPRCHRNRSIVIPGPRRWTYGFQRWIPRPRRWAGGRQRWIPRPLRWTGEPQRWIPCPRRWTGEPQRWIPCPRRWTDEPQRWIPRPRRWTGGPQRQILHYFMHSNGTPPIRDRPLAQYLGYKRSHFLHWSARPLCHNPNRNALVLRTRKSKSGGETGDPTRLGRCAV